MTLKLNIRDILLKHINVKEDDNPHKTKIIFS